MITPNEMMSLILMSVACVTCIASVAHVAVPDFVALLLSGNGSRYKLLSFFLDTAASLTVRRRI